MDWHHLTKEETAKKWKTDCQKGLKESQATSLLHKYGPNLLPEAKGESLIRRFFHQFSDFMVLILLIAAGVSFLTSFLQKDEDYLDAIVILIIVTVNAVIGTLQESRAEKAISALRKMATPWAKVIRDGKTRKIPAQEVVPGDLVVLETGNLVPADVRLTETSDLRVEESALTGESVPASKGTDPLPEKIALGDRSNMCFSSTVVAAGNGRGIAVATGTNTQVGKIAHMLQTAQTPQTPLQKKLAVVSRVLGIGVLILCAIIFLMGLFQKIPPLEMFLIAISLAVAAIPEGLPAVVTIVLASGVRRMALKKAIVRHLMAVETLGSASVICSDKTGTLTQNHMTVRELYAAEGQLNPHSAAARRLLDAASLCTNCTADGDKILGEPTERAICEVFGNKAVLDAQFQRVREIPFSSERKRMTVAVRQPDGNYRVIMKGAPDVLYPLCGGLPRQNDRMAENALRVLAVAEKTVSSVQGMTVQQMESGMRFLGLIGLYDPPRKEVKAAVSLCREAGIRPVMITGDYRQTACAVAKELGILKGSEQVITGPQLDAMKQPELVEQIEKCSVFARVSPAHKVRIVQAFQAHGEVVAMTGDGVNDAPALKAADIGCAMGRSGTDVAKGAADMILADDNFTTIVDAVREGRGIYENIRKTIHFLLSCNMGEILAVFVGFLLRLPLPLIAIQLLWINLVTDSLPALALGVEPISPNIMKKPPIRKDEGMFGGGLGYSIVVEGCFIGALSLLAYSIGRVFFDVNPACPVVGRTMEFAVLSLSEIAHTFNMRSEYRIFDRNQTRNPKLAVAAIICTLLMVSVIVFPSLSVVFHTAVLSGFQWLVTILLSLSPILLVELEKSAAQRKRAKLLKNGPEETKKHSAKSEMPKEKPFIHLNRPLNPRGLFPKNHQE
ncbi:cation-translocating P-type ATPase [Caproicibacterium sp. NSD3]